MIHSSVNYEGRLSSVNYEGRLSSVNYEGRQSSVNYEGRRKSPAQSPVTEVENVVQLGA